MAETENSAAQMGRRGGLARAKNLSPERRKEISQKAAITRWGLKRDRSTMIARLSISLLVDPDVERRLEVPLSIKLSELHRVFQTVMGWKDYHLYAFWTGRPWRGGIAYMPGEEPAGKRPVGNAEITLGTMFRGGPDDAKEADKITLGEFLDTIPKKTFTYSYDFGDGWQHTVKVSGLKDRESDVSYPRLLSAIGRCPPEDVGGPFGYRDYLRIVSDPTHSRHYEMVEWSKQVHGIEMPFDPNAVDYTAIQKELQQFWFLNARI